MIEATTAFLFIKDYANNGGDRYFVVEKDRLVEKNAKEIVTIAGVLVCHDFWLIAPALISQAGTLPPLVVDVDEFQMMISGIKSIRHGREKKDVSRRNSFFEFDSELAKNYFLIWNRTVAIDEAVLFKFGIALCGFWWVLENAAREVGELDRFWLIEQPVARYLTLASSRGIAIDQDRLRAHKKSIEHDYYSALKDFSNTYKVPLELPDDRDVIAYLEPLGFDFLGVDVEYVLRFVPMQDNYAEDLLLLRKLAASRNVLTALPLARSRAYPLVNTFGSITSRIYYKDPALQNLAKRHRDIIVSDNGWVFCYVDYGQYEAGIMAALSSDPVLLDLYSNRDMYEEIAVRLFDDVGKRKNAKQLFLSYAYGMSLKSLVDACGNLGAIRQRAKEFFGGFDRFEKWKNEIWAECDLDRRIGTSLGNHVRFDSGSVLTAQERRSAISQVVQGTASLIFKKALLSLSALPDVELVLTMHDAVLVQIPSNADVSNLPKMFSDVMSDHFGGAVIGKAEVGQFFI